MDYVARTLQAKSKRLIELVNNPYCLGPTALLEGVKEVIPALIAENELLRQERNSQQRVAIREMEKVKALTADKDEQAGRIMRMEDELKRAKDALEWLNIQGGLGYTKHSVIGVRIKAIDALLGGKEDV